jgi:hypothetical protein
MSKYNNKYKYKYNKESNRRSSDDSNELEILRKAVELAEEKVGRIQVNSPDVKKIIEIVESYLRKKRCVCYGGTAINNLLPAEDQFYNKDIELPDYDFFSPNALDDAKELADIYYSEGYKDVEAKAGQHFGTFKVFVNFMPVADITQLKPNLFKIILKESVKADGIHYAPPNFLRMSMYLELSRPLGDVSRWEKVFKRLSLLNKNYPLKGDKCQQALFIDSFENDKSEEVNDDEEYILYNDVKNNLISQGIVFFGGYAFSLYTKYLKNNSNSPDFDVLSENPMKTATILKEVLQSNGHKKIKISEKPPIGEIVSPHIEVLVGKRPVACIYQPVACHSYNTIKIKGRVIKIATIDTMLSFYLAFLYEDNNKYDKNKILCMAEYLAIIQSKNKFKQFGLLKRFTLNCYGKQLSREELRGEKNEMYNLLKDKKGTYEYDEYFLNYKPYSMKEKDELIEFKKKVANKKTIKKGSKNKKTKKRLRFGSIEF